MFRHVFATMHEMLDEIIIRYPQAGTEQKKQYFEQLSVLKSISDTFIDEWLQFEEKLADFREKNKTAGVKTADAPAANKKHSKEPQQFVHAGPVTSAPAKKIEEQPKTEAGLPGEESASIVKGQGYFKLFMFRDAAEHFEQAVQTAPENNMARLFLAMTYMHLQEWNEAQRHFQLLVELTDHPKWQALGYNALGCIQAVRMNLDQAEQYFLKAHETDPAFTDPLCNLKSCRQHEGHLSLYFGSGQL